MPPGGHRRAPAELIAPFLVGLAVVGCRAPAPKPVAPPPIVLISIDTLRSDHLPAYGYEGVSTPAIDALRRDAVLFERAYAQVPLTVPSHLSLLTGLQPWESGVRDNSAPRFDAEALPYLPERLRRLGYRTGGAVSVYLLDRRLGWAQGFEFFDDQVSGPGRPVAAGAVRSGMDTLAATRSWLSSVAGERFFLFFHIYEPHTPHDAPPPYPPTYDGDVAAADQVVGGLIDALRRAGVYDRAAVLLLSDHGEGLGDHGESEHGLLLYRESLQVPLLLKLPAAERAGTAVRDVVGLLDVAPTLLALAGGAPEPRQRGHSLLAPAGAGTPRQALAETLYPRLHFGWSDLASVIEGNLHYIDGPGAELYDLAADPGETANLLAGERRDAARLKAALAGVDRRAAPVAAPDAESRRALASLGYLGGVNVSAPAGPLPNPRDRVGTLATLERGMRAFAAGDARAAAGDLAQAVRENPGVVDGWDYLGRAQLQLGEWRACITAFAEVLRLTAHAPEAASSAARCLLELGQPQDALTLVRGEVRRSPEEAQLRLLQAQLELMTHDAVAARATVGELLRSSPDLPDAIYLRGAIAMGSGDPAGAEADFRRTLTLDPAHGGALSDFAVLLGSQGRNGEARALLERFLAIHPEDATARRNLAALGPS